MTYPLMAAMVTLSAVTLAWAAASSVVALASIVLRRWVESDTASACATRALRLRLLPAAMALAAGFCVVLPLFLWFEPTDTSERVPVTLIVLGAFGFGLIARTVWRALFAIRASQRLSDLWRKRGRAVDTIEAPLPIVAVERGFPAVAVVGFRCPVLFIASSLLRDCSDEELRAIVAHECAHVDARDNLKRLLLRAVPELGVVGRALERAWSDAAEEAADAAAVAQSPVLAVPLAQALVRAARLTHTAALEMPLSAFNRDGQIETRVRKLLAPMVVIDRTAGFPWYRAVALACAAATLVVAAPAIHQLMEALVAWLP
jgi:Zn-dependent protease with chaperone function